MAKDNLPVDDLDELDDDLDLEEPAADGKDAKSAAKSSKSDPKADKGGKGDKKKKEGAGKKIAKWFRDARGEFKKIIWPTRKTVIRNTSVTIAMCAIVGIFVSLFDWGLSALIKVFTSNF